MEFETVIGLEVHAQLLTKSKLFCGCPTTFGAEPNTNICPVCTGQPGALPVLNRTAVDYAIRAGLATNCTIAGTSVFARKNYFYPDLPKGYQISQFDKPLCEHGHVDYVCDGTTHRITIQRIHMEEDAGKSVHDIGDPRLSHVDLNRSSMPLIEIVSGPDIRNAEQAVAYLKTLRAMLMYLEICDGNMQEGSLRCDANVSIRPMGSTTLGTRTELKNINSFRYLERAINYEVERQIQLVSRGEKIVQETRLWDEKTNRTESMRSKEEAHDYRYFPEPDLPPLHTPAAWVDRVRAELPELAEQKIARYTSTMGLSDYDARVLTGDKALATYFEAACGAHKVSAKLVANWISSELLGRLNTAGSSIEETTITPAHIAELVHLIESNTISGKMAKDVFDHMYTTGKAPGVLVKELGLQQITDTGAIDAMIDEVLAANADNIAAYKAGKVTLMGFFVGQVMKKSKGQANPALLNELLKKKLD